MKNLPVKLRAFLLKNPLKIVIGLSVVCILVAGLYLLHASSLRSNILILETQDKKLKQDLQKIKSELTVLQKEDQYVKNKELEIKIGKLESSYKNAVMAYEAILDLDAKVKKDAYNKLFVKSLRYLSEKNYASSEATLADLNKQLKDEKQKIISSFQIPANVTSSNTAPSSGYSRQQVQTDIGTFLVDIISADLGSTRVVVDTASDSDCRDNCPVLSLSDYVSRSGAYAGINGSYFCPAEYPSCAGKTNSFDTLAMNKNKQYLNSDNNVYSTIPAVIFLGGSIRYVGQSLEWGRDTGVDGVLANQPLLLSGGNITFGGNGDPKQGSKGSRSFVGSKGSTVYIGIVHNATVAETAHVLKTLGLEGALNLDSGGSTALWHGGYKAGPGRNIPNAILFIRK